MDDLERYVDILFADYRKYVHAEKLRISMLNDLLLQKEKLQLQGRNENDAIREVLSSLDDFGAPAEGNCLVFSDFFRRDEATSRLLWLIAGTVLSAPCLVVGQYWLSIVMAVLTLLSFFLSRNTLRQVDAEKVGFFDIDDFRAVAAKYWRYWLIGSLVYLAFAYLWNTGRIPFLNNALVDGPLGLARQWLRFYPPFVLLVLPLWASERPRLLLKHEMGLDAEAEVRVFEEESDEPPVTAAEGEEE